MCSNNSDRHTEGDPLRWALKNNFLSGITLAPWLRFLADNRTFIDWRPYWHRLLFLTAMATFNSVIAAWEALCHGRAIAQQRLHPEPVFILGHPRTGTTHLHNLLSQDTNRFAFCTTLMAGFPSSFVSMARAQWLLAPLLDATRPMDAMALSLDLPAEDEIATAGLSGGISPYMCLALMNRREYFLHFLSFERVAATSFLRWQRSFLWFLRKVTYAQLPADQQPKQLLIKSPVHTARIPLLLRLFPAAKFIFIHRDPMEVFQSSMHMGMSYFPYCSLHAQTRDDLMSYTLDHGQLLMRAYCRDRSLIPNGNLLEVSFTDLECDAVGTLRGIYDAFGWSGFGSLEGRLDEYNAALAGFRKNQHVQVTREEARKVVQQWHEACTSFGYPVPDAQH